MTQKELHIILSEHRRWLETNGLEGKRANLSQANLFRANLFRANLSGANLSKANLFRANLSGANLSKADLSQANLFGADLSQANLFRANLSGANLSEANLSEANLFGADLFGANLFKANLSGANLQDIKGKFIFTFQIGKDFSYYADGNVKIGCQEHTLDYWLENAIDIGKDNGYSDREIQNYLTILSTIKHLNKDI